MQDYRKLLVWTKAHANTLQVRKTVAQFPRSGYGSLKSQMTTAAESIAFNIVEGSSSDTQKEFARFLQISIKSATELEYQLSLARDYEVLAGDSWQALREKTVEIRRMLCGLRRKVLGEERLDEPGADSAGETHPEEGDE